MVKFNLRVTGHVEFCFFHRAGTKVCPPGYGRYAKSPRDGCSHHLLELPSSFSAYQLKSPDLAATPRAQLSRHDNLRSVEEGHRELAMVLVVRSDKRRSHVKGASVGSKAATNFYQGLIERLISSHNIAMFNYTGASDESLTLRRSSRIRSPSSNCFALRSSLVNVMPGMKKLSIMIFFPPPTVV